MKSISKASRLSRTFVGWLWLWLACNVAAQPALFTYDPAGNPTTVSVGVSSKPSITASPQAGLLQSNSLAIFSVSATGAGLAYQWLSNGIPILGATGDSLLLANLPLV